MRRFATCSWGLIDGGRRAGCNSDADEPMTNSDEMTRYLFGELSEAEQAQLEARYFTDAQVFNQLAQLEAELIDDYARGRLSAQMRARFERAYLSNPNRRARLKFGEALTARLDQMAASSVAEPARMRAASLWQRAALQLAGKRRALAFSTVLALLLLSAVTVWLFIESQQLRQDLARTRDAQSAQAEQAREAEQQLASERTRSQALAAELERARAEAQPQTLPAATAPSVASLMLVVGNVRGVDMGAPPTLVIRKATQQVRLQLKLRENRYPSYQLALQAVGGKEIFTRQQIKPLTSQASASFIFTLPAAQVSAGDYLLTLRGYLPNGELEDVSQSLFHVEKK